METRELRYFLAVAQERNFGRAAQRLGIAQPPLSRAIQRLERRLGVTLFTRTSTGADLTPAGVVLLREGRTVLAALDAAEQRTIRAERDDAGLVLVTKAGASVELLADLLQRYAATEGSVDVDVVLCGPAQPARLLREGRADVAILHRPFDDLTGLDHEDLTTEGQVAVLPSTHPLAQRDSLLTEDVNESDLLLPRWPDEHGNHHPGPGVAVRDHQQLLQMVGLGRAVVILPESVRSELREVHAAVPVVDAAPVTTVIAWPPGSTSRTLAGLVRTATGPA